MTSSSSYLLLNDLRFHYLDWGGEGRPLVLLHGLASNARIWDFVAPQLAAPGRGVGEALRASPVAGEASAGHFRVLALDQRSHGLTDPADDGFNFAAITRDLHAFVDTLHLERPLLVGHSWGASTVLNYAALRPMNVAGIVMVDGGMFSMSDVPEMTWEKAEALLRPPDLDGMPVAEFRARMRNWLPDGLEVETVAPIVLASFRIDDDERLYRRLPIPQHMQIARAIYEKKTFDLFARVRCPVLLCPADETPRDERSAQFRSLKHAGIARIAQVNGNTHTRWFPDTIHDIPLQRPTELAHAIAEFGLQIMD
ncbi:MAG: alpha/beta fold hydrolase [Anaerolineales bacterium]